MSLDGTKTHENLKAAFAGESQANRRYLYFARAADIEGYPEAAGVFKNTKLPMSPEPPAIGSPIVVLSFVQLNTVVPSVFVVVNSIASVDSPSHKIWLEILFTWAVGFTVIVKVSDGPSQLIPLFV